MSRPQRTGEGDLPPKPEKTIEERVAALEAWALDLTNTLDECPATNEYNWFYLLAKNGVVDP